MDTSKRFNPFPGLRSFEEDEDFLFFGREEQTDELLKKLGNTRFLAVVGNSGSGKSSLVKSGLLPFLHSGYMVKAGSSWKVAVARPGNDPIGNVAKALAGSKVLYKDTDESMQSMYAAIIESTLRRSTLGLSEAVKQSDLNSKENLLVVIDQFEELFRFNRYEKLNQQGKRDSLHFVDLLLNAGNQREIPIYIVFTMRSDFIGECTQFRGLPEAINEGQYLIPRMTREERKSAITGPVAVGGAKITPRLVTRLLNDVGDSPDQLPILQHALMRTWNYWSTHSPSDDPIDLAHYESIGTMKRALSLHAEEAYNELKGERERQLCEILFKALTDKGVGGQGIRRPCKLSEICAISGATIEEYIPIIDTFRKPGISFLMPPLSVPLESQTIIDISHESLMRVWTRLIGWVEEETQSAEIYLRLSEAAALYHEGKTDLWKGPELQLTLNWKEESQVNEVWANRYDPSYERAFLFLQYSKEAYQLGLEEKEKRRKAVLRRTRSFASVLGVAFLLSILMLIIALNQRQQAIEQEKNALVAKEVAIEERERADILRNEADASRVEAEESRKTAIIEKDNALEQKRRAEALQIVANKEKNKALIAKIEADSLRIRAENQRKIAEGLQLEAQKQEQEALRQKDLAVKSEEAAKLAREKAEELRLLELGQSIALQTLRIDREKDPELVSLLAYTAYRFNIQYNGNPNDPDIYRALSYASYSREDQVYSGHQEAVRALSFSPYGKYFASGSDDGKVLIWETNNKAKPIKSYTVRTDGYPNIRSLEFTKEHIIASTAGGKIIAWDRRDINKPYEILYEEKSPVKCIAVSPADGTLVAGNDRGEVLIWKNGDLLSMHTIVAEVDDKIFDISFSPSNNLVGIATEFNGVLVFNYEGQDLISFRSPDKKLYSLAFSSDGKYLAAGSSEGTILVWDVKNPQMRPEILNAHESGINALVFSPDNRTLASAGADGLVSLWNIDNLSAEPRKLAGHEAWVWDISFSPDGNYLISGGSDDHVRIWETRPERMADKLCSKFKRDLSYEEWKTYVGNDVEYKKGCKE